MNAPAQKPDDTASAGLRAGSGGHILLVDDSHEVRALLTRGLSCLGYRVSDVADGATALERVKAGGIELVLLDIQMPGMDGFEVLAALRREHDPVELPVIMVTAGNKGEDILRAIRADASDYLVKPIEFESLQWRIETHLARRRAELALRESEERFKLALRGSNEGLWDWNCDTGAIYFGLRWKSVIGYGADDGPRSFEDWVGLIHGDDRAAFQAAIDAHLRGDTPQLDVEYRMRHRAGEYRWVRTRGAASATSGNRGSRMVGSQSDVTGRKLVDAATGLPNRVQFREAVEHALAAQRPFAVALINIDRFRLINEGLGPEAGDRVLKDCAARLSAELDQAHVLARLGGDQFGLLARDVSSELEMGRLIARCRQRFASPLEIDGHALHVSFRAGAVIAGVDHRVPGDLLHHADLGLRSAKLQPGERVAFAERPARGAALTRLKLENDIQRALADDEFIAVYHPIVALETGRTVGFEALARWHKPGQPLIAPGVFVGVAEETALIGAIDDRVLGAACREAMQWPGDLFISVNVSGYRFGDPALTDGIDRRLAESGLDPRRLKLEITESTIMTDAATTARTVAAFTERGIGVSIDDFGTGYSSLAYLHRFDASTLKIDRSFVQAMDSGHGLEIVRMIVMLARTLKMSVVAEGIETKAQLDALRALGCDFGQGYYFAKPLSVADARARLAQESGPLKQAM
jgi:diguanylate cyclase (GGDEF)-like protein/PAS domain S-box-containing protein